MKQSKIDDLVAELTNRDYFVFSERLMYFLRGYRSRSTISTIESAMIKAFPQNEIPIRELCGKRKREILNAYS